MRRGKKITGPRARRMRARFLAELSAGRSVAAAAAGLALSRDTLYTWRQRDLKFQAAWDLAVEDAGDALEVEARRRAVEGVEESVYHGGEIVGSVRKYSDQLLMFLLRGARPDKYRDRSDVTTGGQAMVAAKILVLPADPAALPGVAPAARLEPPRVVFPPEPE